VNQNSSFIEVQFPIAKVSAESYKERMAGAGSSQTLTGLGKWWGRKPLVLVRACLIGLLMPASDDPKKDRDIFLKIMTMDEEGLWRRKEKPIPIDRLFELLSEEECHRYLIDENGEPRRRWKRDEAELRDHVQRITFSRLSYEEKLDYCLRPEQIDGPSPEAWSAINAHLGTEATNLVGLIAALGRRRFGRVPRVGDAFCGGGSIPFEAARIGCEAYGSDINPVAALLTWGALHLVGGDPATRERIAKIRQDAFDKTRADIRRLGLETNEQGWQHEQLYYVVEVKCPASGLWTPLAPSWVISEKYRVCAVIEPNHAHGNFDIHIVEDATAEQMKQARTGTLQGSRLVCPVTKESYSLADLRGDRRIGGDTVYGLRQWENHDLVPRPDDTLQERLYCIRWSEAVPAIDAQGNPTIEYVRHYCAPTDADIQRENTVLELIQDNLTEWQRLGYIPSNVIPPGGEKTEEPIRTRGWTHWHHLFTPRQLFMLGSFSKHVVEENPKDQVRVAAAAVGVGAALERLSKLCGIDPHISKGPGSTMNVFFNQALNPQMVFGSRQLKGIERYLCADLTEARIANDKTEVVLRDARSVAYTSDIWFTDPPYADAVNYHELTDYFLAWYEHLLPSAFPDWQFLDKDVLAVRGKGEDFKRAMVDIYHHLGRQMPDDGMQLVQFTHQDPSVWGDLGMILWAAGLAVSAAWTVATETASGGIKKGNYVQGTVNLVLRKRTGDESAFLDEIYPLIEDEVKRQLDSMTAIDDDAEPNFGDTDYQLAAYAAALRVLTRYADIEGMDIRHELFRERARGEKSEFEKVIDRAVEIACNHLIPRGFDEFQWKALSNYERLYLKGLELERHGEMRAGAYQELAKGFGVREYRNLYGESTANAVRFKTASEFKRTGLEGEGFDGSLVRHTLFAVYEAVRQDNAQAGLNYLKTDGAVDYWSQRKKIMAILAYLKDLQHVPRMAHWHTDADAAERLAGAVENDHG
jgi:putative DNA methylase